MTPTQKIKVYHQNLLNWFESNKRFYKWRYTNNPYYILVCEVLLVQTNVDKVVPAFESIINMYPDISLLSKANSQTLAAIFDKLGLFYRVDRLISIAKDIVENHDGRIPSTRDQLLSVNGVGDYTANALLSFAFKQPYAILDTNVIRVIGRVFNVWSDKKRPRTDQKLWDFAQQLLPSENYIDYNYAILDFASLICKARKPECKLCPLIKICCWNRKPNNR